MSIRLPRGVWMPRLPTSRASSVPRARLEEILSSVAFQCHKTLDGQEQKGVRTPRAQQCAGLMALLHRCEKPNQIMQVAERLAGFDPSKIEAQDVYPDIESLLSAHGGRN